MSQPRIYLSSPHMGGDELKLVQETFASNWIAPLGPQVDAFEREFAELIGGRTAEGGVIGSGLSVIGGAEGGRGAEGGVIGSGLLVNGGTAEDGRRTTDGGGRTTEGGVIGSGLLVNGGTTEDGRRTTDDRGRNSELGTRNPEPSTAGGMHAAALSSGTAALHLALRWLNLQPGDEVICSTLTFSASVNPVLYERATPVFVDSDTRSWNMDPALLGEAIADCIRRGKKPKAVVLVHLYGQSADLDPIAELCAQHGIPLIEDAAEALGAIYYRAERLSVIGSELLGGAAKAAQSSDDPAKAGQLLDPRTSNQEPITSNSASRSATNNPQPVTNNPTFRRAVAPGSVGLCGVHSFNGNKIITTSGGGMLVSRDAKLIDKARFWATQSRDPAPHYQHSEVGFNYRMSNVLAAIGRGQLRVLEQRVEARRGNCAYYQRALGNLPGLSFMPEADYGRCTRWLTCITIDPAVAGTDREKARLALAGANIEARPIWKPMHLQPLFKDCRCYGGDVSTKLFENGLCLPSGSNLTEADLRRVSDVVRSAFGR